MITQQSYNPQAEDDDQGNVPVTEHVFDIAKAVPKEHDMVDRGMWFTCNDCPLRIYNKEFKHD